MFLHYMHLFNNSYFLSLTLLLIAIGCSSTYTTGLLVWELDTRGLDCYALKMQVRHMFLHYTPLFYNSYFLSLTLLLIAIGCSSTHTTGLLVWKLHKRGLDGECFGYSCL